MSTFFNIKVQDKSRIFPIEISVKTLYFIMTASFCLTIARNAGNCTIMAGTSELKMVVKPRSTPEPVVPDYKPHASSSVCNLGPGP